MKKLWMLLLTLFFVVGLISPAMTIAANSEGDIAMTVNGTEYTDHGTGWSAAVKLASGGTDVTVKLFSDWIADAENGFVCPEGGTKNGYLYLNDNHIITIDLNGHKIDRNLSEPTDDGLVFRLYDYDAKLTIRDSVGGGQITGANNDGDGGAFFVERGSLYIEGGEIRENKATNGAGIYWESQNDLCIYGGVIAANEAEENGGGIYGTDWGNIYFGGNAIISGNIDKNSENNNLYLEDNDVVINRTAGQSENIPDVPFTEGASIGISAYDFPSVLSGNDSRFEWDDLHCFFSDSDKYYIYMDYDANGGNHSYIIYIDSVENMPEPIPAVVSVSVEGGATQDFGDFNKGWSYALRQSLYKPTTIKLLADLTAENGSFDYDSGTKNGYFYLNDNYDITIDLNGHKIDRSLKNPTEYGVVFWLYDYDVSLTIKDSIGGGKITGANNIGNGGAFFVERGSLYIEGGEISGNKAANGAGIYWESRNDLYIYGGNITENTASANGGGIYLTDWGNVYVGGSIVVDGNTGGTKSENVYLSDLNVFLKYAVGQNVSAPFTSGAKIGLTCREVVHYVQFTNADSGFDADCSQYFVPDDDMYFIDNVYDDVNGIYNFSVSYDQDGYMCVNTNNSEKRFSDFGKGWVYALKMSMEAPTTIKLESDWTPCTDTGFCYIDEGGSEYGTDKGRLYLNNIGIDLTIDLNGHSISRSLTTPVENGQVFCMSAGSLTIIDTSESKNGKITGGNNSGNGGGFYAYGGTIHLKGGSITGNNASRYGGGIYIDETELFLEGGSVSENTTGRDGGGIYVYDATLTIEDGEVSRNYAGMDGGGVYCYNNAVVYMKGGIVADNECERDGGGFHFSMEAQSMHMTGGTLIRNKAATGGGGIYWMCNGILALTGGVITENHTGHGYNSISWNSNYGGGIYAYHSKQGFTHIGSDPYIGGDIKIYNNTACVSESILPSWNGVNVVESNLYLSENSIKLKQALGQEDGVPNVPLTDGAYVGIGMKYEYVITDESSKFDQASLKYLHSDANNFYINSVLENGYYTLSLVKKSGAVVYNENAKEVAVEIKEAGKYMIAFADYENGCLANVDIVEYDFKAGINIVPQEVKDFALEKGDKIMIWYDMLGIAPVCEVLILK